MKKIISVFLFGLLLSNCNYKKDVQNKNEHKRLDGIPNQAFWIGGMDGVNWFVIDSINKNSKSVTFEIYNDNSGQLIEKRIFTLSCNSETVIKWNNLQEEINGYDGKIILLKAAKEKNIACCFQ